MLLNVLSTFDFRKGPMVFMRAPERGNSIPLDSIPLLMDLYKKGFFIHEFNDLRSANYIFEIYNPIARGRREVLMISIISYQDNFYIDLSSFKEVLESFAVQLSSIDDIYKGLHPEEFPEGNEKRNIIAEFVHSFQDILPSEQEIYHKMFTQINTLRLSSKGKSAILSNLQEKFNHQKPLRKKLFSPEGNFQTHQL